MDVTFQMNFVCIPQATSTPGTQDPPLFPGMYNFLYANLLFLLFIVSLPTHMKLHAGRRFYLFYSLIDGQMNHGTK